MQELCHRWRLMPLSWFPLMCGDVRLMCGWCAVMCGDVRFQALPTNKQTSKPYCRSSNYTFLPVVRDRRHYRYSKNAQEIDKKTKSYPTGMRRPSSGVESRSEPSLTADRSGPERLRTAETNFCCHDDYQCSTTTSIWPQVCRHPRGVVARSSPCRSRRQPPNSTLRRSTASGRVTVTVTVT